jgi:hypothetical protein
LVASTRLLTQPFSDINTAMWNQPADQLYNTRTPDLARGVSFVGKATYSFSSLRDFKSHLPALGPRTLRQFTTSQNE